MLPIIKIYTDGACKGNPGFGGYAALLQMDMGNRIHEKLVSGHVAMKTTNNRMELTAVIAALSNLTKSCRVELFTDSRYVIQVAINCRAKKNLDLVAQLRTLLIQHQVTFSHVNAHSNHLENDRVDAAASAEADQAKLKASR